MDVERKPNPVVIANALGTDELAPWEEQFARWMAAQTTRVDHEDEETIVRLLVGHDLSRRALRQTKTKIAWKRVYQNARAEVYEEQLKRAKGRAVSMMPKAMGVLGKAVAALDREFDRGFNPDGSVNKDVDLLPAIRSTPPLLTPLLDRVIPRKTETSTTATTITVNLTPEQAAGMDAPIRVVTAEEVIKALPETTSTE